MGIELSKQAQAVLERAKFDLSFANFKSNTFANNNAAEDISPGHVTTGQEIENVRLLPIIRELLLLIERLRRASDSRCTDYNYLTQMLLSCVERAEGIIDGGPITAEAFNHWRAWLRNVEEKEALAHTDETLKKLGEA